MSIHTLSVLVENKPGVLARIAGLFSRRGFNIDSLAVGPTEHPEISRMTIVVNVEESPLEQVTKQLNKLIEVIKIVELEVREAIERELVLVKVKADVDTRSQVLDVVQLFKARVVDVATDAITLEVTGNSDKLADFLKVIEPFGIRELVQSGLVAIGRGGRSITERTQVLQTAELFRARVIDVNPETVTLEATGTPDKLQALLAVLAPLGIKEMAQSGTVALGRGPRSMSGAGTLRPVERTA